VFARLTSLRMLVNAISASIMPVINALIIVMTIIAIYAVLGVTFFAGSDPDNFAVFTIALFTMFQIATLDDWGTIARAHVDTESGIMHLSSGIFFMSFLLIVAFTLLPVVVAVLLDNFTVATRNEKDKQLLRLAQAEEQKVVYGLDPLIKTLVAYLNQEEITQRLQVMFDKLDSDRSGALS